MICIFILLIKSYDKKEEVAYVAKSGCSVHKGSKSSIYIVTKHTNAKLRFHRSMSAVLVILISSFCSAARVNQI